ncbi:hypothetical protein C0991_005170, partial [Blastosporella zonata]
LSKEKVAQYDAEIAQNEDKIRTLQILVDHQKGKRDRILKELEDTHPSKAGRSHGKGNTGIDYAHEQYEWTKGLKAKMKSVFGIADFRLCQEGCVSPTQLHTALTNH